MNIKKEKEMYVLVQQARERHNQLEYGPGIPTIQEESCLLAFLDVRAASKKEMTRMIEKLSDNEEYLEELISGVYIEEATIIRPLIGMQHFDQRKLIVQSMKQLDFKHMPGCPPPGYMENQLSSALENLSL